MAILEFDEVYKTFCNENKELLVIDNMNFKVEKGEIIAITGPSGCGKSTILNLISKLEEPTYGKVTVDGEIGYMFQHDHLFNYRNVYQNVILGLEIKKEHKNQNLLNEVNRLINTYGLSEFKNRYPNELSGGMRQRVALIRTLAVNPDILLLDEPFAALDYQTKLNVIDDIHEIIKREERTTIIVTHDISEAISIADKVIVLSKRPSRIKKIYDIKLTINGKRTPYESRKAKEFKDYFDDIWKELTDD
ncbi:MAG: ABC transporter ATP-binding protein [Coprobacillus sp.]|nr:ABC transporter ATP-binding protein [Coprobacillus sp.]MDY4145798.1 ABC transporter ATP-binding protein [Bacilli bacterium]